MVLSEIGQRIIGAGVKGEGTAVGGGRNGLVEVDVALQVVVARAGNEGEAENE